MHSIILVIHVLGWVFWLGTDVGVFIGAKFSEKSELSVETRLTALKVGMILDIFPRIAVPVVFMTGIYLTASLGLAEFVPTLAAYGFGAIWLAAVITGIATEGGQGTLGGLAMKTQFIINVIVAIVMGGISIAALLGMVDMPNWLAFKWLAYAVIALAAIILEHTFKPAIALYQKLGTEGASPELNSALTKSLQPVYRSVLLIYAATLVAGVSGLLKF